MTKDQNRALGSGLEQSTARELAKELNKLLHRKVGDRVRYFSCREDRISKFIENQKKSADRHDGTEATA